jgi:nicotinamidase-related amidase
MAQRVHVLIIDPQNDFTEPKGSLFVNGAVEDTQRLTAFIDKNSVKLSDIHVTLDSHHQFQIFHPMYWRGADGKEPSPFTTITVDDILNGVWNTRIPALRDKALEYVKALKVSGRYTLTIWPVHCLIGSWGTLVQKDLFEALLRWETKNVGMVDFVTKGSNLFTEHYSAVKAEVPDAGDPGTQLNQQLIDILQDADQVLVGGQALDYCVYNTIKDVTAAFGPANAQKITILEDCTSPIDPTAVAKIKAEFGALGIKFAKSTDVF